MNIIEKLEALIKFHSWDHEHANGDIENLVSVYDLRAIIEEYKNAKEPVAYMFCGNLSGVDLLSFNKPDHTNSVPNTCVELFTHPPLSDETVKVPEGYALVPIEPTPEMIEAGDKVAEIHNEYGVDLYIENTNDVYKAMIDEAMKADNAETKAT